MTTPELCADCQIHEGSHDIRKRQLCSDCFIIYVNSKVLKRMESYRFKNLTGGQKKRLFLPCSGGVSSLVLLHALDAQLKKQVDKQNRTAYDLVLAHVLAPESSVSADWFQRMSRRFSSHAFLPPVNFHEALKIDQNLEQGLVHLGVRRAPGQDDLSFYNIIMSSVTTVTTRRDLQELFLRRLLISLAKQSGCASILWGHSDSKLAAQVLSGVAKGRGASVPAEISDGLSPSDITFNYPMRDLFKSELELYANIFPEPLEVVTEADPEPTPSIRNTSIDNLFSNYILSQGEKYPSIVANVVRTASKLQAPKMGSEAQFCPLCNSQVDTGRAIGGNDRPVCYGCERMKQDIRVLI
jgi:cytoplasmic tRNA 2-thiolation protein 2